MMEAFYLSLLKVVIIDQGFVHTIKWHRQGKTVKTNFE